MRAGLVRGLRVLGMLVLLLVGAFSVSGEYVGNTLGLASRPVWAESPNSLATNSAVDGWFRVSFGAGPSDVAPIIQGEVHNASPYRVTDVRLLVGGLDGGDQSVGWTSTWGFGDIAPSGDTSFVVPTIPGAITYRIRVVSFDVVSVGERAAQPSGAGGSSGT